MKGVFFFFKFLGHILTQMFIFKKLLPNIGKLYLTRILNSAVGFGVVKGNSALSIYSTKTNSKQALKTLLKKTYFRAKIK